MKVWVDAVTAPPSNDWTWVKTSQEAQPVFLSKKVTQAYFALNFGDNSAINSITFIRWIYIQVREGNIPRFRWSLGGGISWADVQKAPIVLGEADYEWSKQERTSTR